MTSRAFITGLAGTDITPAERAFLREAAPWGLIIFQRNIAVPEQVRRLVGEFRAAVGRADAPVLVDQEGGRVQRLGPPHWPSYPPGAEYGRLYDRDRAAGLEAARLGARLIASDLAALGIDVDCLPLADVPVAGANSVIGDRAYGDTPEKVAAIAARDRGGAAWRAACCRCSSTSPGTAAPRRTAMWGCPWSTAERAELEATDFAAFRPLAALPMGMTAHVVFTAYRRSRAGHHFGHNGVASDSRVRSGSRGC